MADITSQTLRPALNSYYQTVEDAQLWLHTNESVPQSLLFVSQFNTVEDPIMGYDASTGGTTAVVQRTSSLQLGGSWLASPQLQIGTDFGLNVVQMANGPSYFGVGDLHFMAKQSLLQKENDWGLSLSPDLYIPIPNSHPFMSNETTGFGGRLFFEKNIRSIGLAVNAGYLQFPGATYSTTDYSTQYPLGIGLRIPVNTKVALNFEGMTAVLPNSSLNDGPGDFYVGTRIAVFKGGILSVGGSYGTIPTDGGASVRILVGLAVLPRTKDPTKVMLRETTKQTNTLQACNPKPILIQLPGRSLLTREKQKLNVLPFFVSDNGPFKTIGLNQPSGTTKDGTRYADNSQMIFAIDLSTLPQRSDVVSLENILLKMKVHKLVHHKDSRSGMLCLINEKVCSGDLPNSKIAREKINPLFFNGKEPPNDFFMQSIRGLEKDGIVTANLALPLQKLLENSVAPDSMDVIYDQSGDPKKVLYFAAAPDIYVLNDVQLEVQLTVETCTTSNSETVTEPHSIELEQKEGGI